jgi:hypothetical protein
MPFCNFSLATRQDDQLLRTCLKSNEMKGSISISFESEPSFFDALDIQGGESQVVIAKTDTNKIIGFGVRTINPMYVNGNIRNVGYLSTLRVNSDFRNNTFLARGYRFFRKLDEDGKVPFYLTTIVEDNLDARKILESGKAGLPRYTPLDILSTSIIKPKLKKMDSEHVVLKGNNFSLEEIVRFINMEGKKKQFHPYYDVSDFNSPRLRGLEKKDFYVAVEGDEIIGTLAKWDQSSFKQTRVVGYDKRMRIIRPFINLSSRFSNIPYLPQTGKLLHYFHTAFPTTKDNDPSILESLLKEIASDSKNNDYDYFTIGLTRSDPLREAVKPFSPREYNAIVYLVSFDKSDKKLEYLNGEIPYLELGTL